MALSEAGSDDIALSPDGGIAVLELGDTAVSLFELAFQKVYLLGKLALRSCIVSL